MFVHIQKYACFDLQPYGITITHRLYNQNTQVHTYTLTVLMHLWMHTIYLVVL